MRANNESGFSLLELLIAALLTVGLLGVVFALTGRNQQVFVTESGVTDMNQNVRTAVDFLTRDIQSAGMGMPRPNACFAAIYYVNGAGGAPDQIMIVNGDPYAPTVYINSQPGASSTFSFVKPSDVTVTGSGSSASFTYTDQHTGQMTNLYTVFSSASPKYYVCYDDKKAVVFALTGASQYTAASQMIELTHDTSNSMNRAGIFGTTVDQLFPAPAGDTGQPAYADTTEIAVLGGLIGYRINQDTNELERTEDLTNWYTIARGITNLQIQYRTVTGTIAVPINNIEEAPNDRRTIRAASITISAQTPDMSPGDKGFRQAIQTFEVAPRNLNLLRNNNLSGNAKGNWDF